MTLLINESRVLHWGSPITILWEIKGYHDFSLALGKGAYCYHVSTGWRCHPHVLAK